MFRILGHTKKREHGTLACPVIPIICGNQSKVCEQGSLALPRKESVMYPRQKPDLSWPTSRIHRTSAFSPFAQPIFESTPKQTGFHLPPPVRVYLKKTESFGIREVRVPQKTAWASTPRTPGPLGAPNFRRSACGAPPASRSSQPWHSSAPWRCRLRTSWRRVRRWGREGGEGGFRKRCGGGVGMLKKGGLDQEPFRLRAATMLGATSEGSEKWNEPTVWGFPKKGNHQLDGLFGSFHVSFSTEH